MAFYVLKSYPLTLSLREYYRYLPTNLCESPDAAQSASKNSGILILHIWSREEDFCEDLSPFQVPFRKMPYKSASVEFHIEDPDGYVLKHPKGNGLPTTTGPLKLVNWA